MKRLTSISFVIIIICTSIFAQKEVYFSTIKPDSIKVESLKGLEIQLSTEPISLIQNLNTTPQRYSFPLYVGYFSENRIAPSWTLTYRAGIQNNLGCYQDYKYHYDSIKGYYNMNQIEAYKMVYYNNLEVSIGIDPRWYFDFKNKAILGKANLNSGWFISMPLQITLPLPIYLHTATVNQQPSRGIWPKEYFSINASLRPTIGFRKAISSKWFLEGSADLNLSTYYYSFFLSNSLRTTYISNLLITPELKIKAAYIFK